MEIDALTLILKTKGPYHEHCDRVGHYGARCTAFLRWKGLPPVIPRLLLFLTKCRGGRFSRTGVVFRDRFFLSRINSASTFGHRFAERAERVLVIIGSTIPRWIYATSLLIFFGWIEAAILASASWSVVRHSFCRLGIAAVRLFGDFHCNARIRA